MMDHQNQPADHAAGSSPAGTRPPVPRWVKVSGLVLMLLVVLVVVALLSGHGPARHMGAGPSGAGGTGQGQALQDTSAWV